MNLKGKVVKERKEERRKRKFRVLYESFAIEDALVIGMSGGDA